MHKQLLQEPIGSLLALCRGCGQAHSLPQHTYTVHAREAMKRFELEISLLWNRRQLEASQGRSDCASCEDIH